MSDSAVSKDATLSVSEQLQAELKVIQDQYAASTSTQTGPSADNKTVLDGLLQQVRNVQSSFQASAVSIPSRDQRTLSEAISSLSTSLATARSAAQPRTRFAFKKKASAPVPADAAPVTAASTTTIAPSLSTDPVPLFPSLTPRPIRRPVFPTPLTLRHHTGEDIRPPSTTSGVSTITNLNACLVLLPPGQEGLHLSHCTSSLLVLNSVAGAVHLTSLSRCVIIVAARQVRLHTSTDVDVYLACGSEPVMEDCARIRVSQLPDVWRSWHAGPDLWDAWRDFSWVADGENPHWSRLADPVADDVWRDVVEETVGREEVLHRLGVLGGVAAV